MLYEFEREYSITLPIKPTLAADLWIPHHCQGIVIFAHGSGSFRHSPRNRYVASVLQEAGFATLLADLLTKEEETIDEIDRSICFNITLLAERLIQINDCLIQHPQLNLYPQAYIGASTGAGAA